MPCSGGCGAVTAGSGGVIDERFRRILWVALVANAVMFVVEMASSLVSGSMSLQADALDFLSDSASYAATGSGRRRTCTGSACCTGGICGTTRRRARR